MHVFATSTEMVMQREGPITTNTVLLYIFLQETPDAYDHRQIPLCESKVAWSIYFRLLLYTLVQVSSDDDSYEGARPTSIEMVNSYI